LTILVTGSAGLVGHFLVPRLKQEGFATRGFDIRRTPAEDVRNAEAFASAIDGVEGIVHLAAVSRVVWGERDPENCIATNITGLQTLLETAAKSKTKPWILFASSREVYGNATDLPVSEDAPLRPINLYARTKQEGERRVQAAREVGLVTNIARLSSVYGWIGDHDDRVVPAFAIAAARGGRIRVDGKTNTLDFAFVDDVVEGLTRFVIATARGERLPVIHFVSGKGLSLGGLADIALSHARKPVDLTEGIQRDYAVSRFIGDPTRAAKLLNWSAALSVEAGMKRLVDAYVAADSS
jgi:UDP-glucose 4-epimerase